MTATVPADLDTSELTAGERAELSSVQFHAAVANDDLEMAEDIFSATRNSSERDMRAFCMAVLKLAINLSDQAKSVERAKRREKDDG